MKRVIIYLLLLGCLFHVAINVFDILSIARNPEEYERVYHLGNSEHLQFQSVSTYILWRVFQCIILLPLLVALLRKVLGKPISPLLRKTSYLTIFGIALWIIYYYLMWYKSGYDHYPGFDPYLF